MFGTSPVRGEYVSLRESWQEALRHRDYPPPVRRMLGEMMAAAALLSANLKFEGSLVMQIHGDGPVRMAVVQCNADLSLRVTARLADDAEPLPDDASVATLVNRNGTGRFVMTLNPPELQPGQHPYQGIVPLSDESGPLQSVAAVLEHYMRHSEQLETRLWLAADPEQAVGLLLQKLPDHGGSADAIKANAGSEPNAESGTGSEAGFEAGLEAGLETGDDTWARVGHLAATVRREELLTYSGETLLHRLFWQEPLSDLEPAPVRFACSCSREKVGAMLRMLGQEEANGVLRERGEVEIHCEFCNRRYAFDAVDVAQLFAGGTISESVKPPAPPTH